VDDKCSEYCLLRLLGEGSFGSVYKAEHKESKAVVAVKVIPNGSNSSDEEKVKGEIEILSRCDSLHTSSATSNASFAPHPQTDQGRCGS
jgi:serine/threonine protein kinase